MLNWGIQHKFLPLWLAEPWPSRKINILKDASKPDGDAVGNGALLSVSELHACGHFVNSPSDGTPNLSDSWQSIFRNMHPNFLSLPEWPVTILLFLWQVFLLNESSQSPDTFVPIYTALWRREQSQWHYWQWFGYRAGCLRWCCQRYCNGSMMTTEQKISVLQLFSVAPAWLGHFQ